ncbi:hypothetical protein CDO73_15990 [Saccharibacillus sp. O23]|uniref:YitT family protein n=1 Tax=Saccharibacillus sp. O23 TaxID=2009338 RepID=UPI000B4E40DC|nr:YitT family protein [Saccharibacillus sp. O23]OWR29162.1 hypothetical protein CDO73_15990 [Saccharibacillus sp. O23]
MNMDSTAAKIRTVAAILLGTALYAFGLLYFIIPNKFTEGGVTGITVLLNYGLGIPTALSTLVLNVPLVILGWRILGLGQIVYTAVGIASLSLFLWLFQVLFDRGILVQHAHDPILAALYAGIVLGLGLGIVFRFGGTTGGSDIIARILNRKKGWSMGRVILAIDVMIIGLSLFFIAEEKVLYTLVAVFIASKVIDFVQEGAYAARAFMIISNEAEPIADRIMAEMDRGVTLIPAFGAYSKHAKHIAYCVISRQEIRQLQLIVKSVDPRAFIIVNDVHDVQGEGFRE